MKKYIIVFILFLVLLTLTGCQTKKYSEDEILTIVAERIEEIYFSNDRYEVESFEVYPIYNENDKFSYVLVEYNPSGYIFVKVEYTKGLFPKLKLTRDTNEPQLNSWVKRYYDNGKVIYCEKDENNKPIQNYVSPFKKADVLDKKIYLIYLHNMFCVPAIKKDDQYLNLISFSTFTIDGVNLRKVSYQPGFEHLNISFQDNAGRGL